MMYPNTPDPKTVRERITNVKDKDLRFFLMALYLFCARASELCGLVYRCDKVKRVYGPKGEDAFIEHWQDETYSQIQADVAVFTIKTAKRDGFIRNIGLPVEYEPWAMPLYEYYQQFKGRRVFHITRQKANRLVREKKVFNGLTYPISQYHIVGDPEPVKPHQRDLVLHGLRHVRATELMEKYQFNLEQVALYGGWTLRSVGGQIVTPVLVNHYLSLGYRFYIGKLLKKY